MTYGMTATPAADNHRDTKGDGNNYEVNPQGEETGNRNPVISVVERFYCRNSPIQDKEQDKE
jgi:hypothetical protein